MRFTRQIISVQSIALFILIACSAPTARAKSVYAIIDNFRDIIGAYKIDSNQIDYQAEIQTPQHGDRAIDLAIDSGSSCIFVTYEGSNIIEIMNAKTLEHEGSVTAFGATLLAGIVFDEAKQKLYTVGMGTENLFVYFWDAADKTLIPDGINPKILTDLSPPNAHGIALDANSNHLYVANLANIVHYYDTNDWSHIDYVNVGQTAVDIDIDSNRGYLYAGGYIYHDYLLKLNLSTGIAEANDIGAGVIGLAVDPNSGLVYTTTFHNQFRVYDTSVSPFNLTDYEDISAGCGVCVPTADVTYKDPFPLVTLKKDANGVICVSPLISQAEHEFLGDPYNWLYYNIKYDANGFADTNVFITDHLPVEVDYNSSDPCGLYDPIERTVTWEIPVMSASDSNTYRIQVAVNYYAKPGHKIFNLCEIESDRYYKYTTIDTNVCCYGGDIIYVDADANDPNSYHNGTSWLHAYKDLQEALHTARTCGCEQIWVAKGTYKPTKRSARSTSFDLVDNVAVYGGFPPGGGAWTQRNPSAYETILSGDIAALIESSDNSYNVVKSVDVNNVVLDGFIITAGKADGSDANAYGGGIYCKDSNDLIVRNCSISFNSAYYGGAVYNYSSDPNINNCIFFYNEATYDDGGGIYNCYQSSPTIINCTFSGNLATTVGGSHGGAIYNTDSSDPNIINCTFNNNSAYRGGAVYNNSSYPNITNCIFTDNEAIYYGGGIDNSNQSSPTIINCTFSGNLTTTVGDSHGGAICNWNNSDPNITNCMFINNSAHEGGAIYNYYYSDPNIANCILTTNDANMGGALFNSYDSDPNITNCIFVGNTADSYGGGMYNYYESYPAVINSIFIGNRADIYGGGIASYVNISLALTNCTVSGNSAYSGGGIWSWYLSDTDITNCILWANEANFVDEIFVDDPNTTIISYSDIKDSNGSGDNWVDEIGTDVGYNIDEDPCFFSVEDSNGSWTENASYDSSTFQSTLTDSDANWAVNELAGKFVSPNTPQVLQFLIVSNNVNTMKVWSDVNDIAKDTRTYQIYDYHLRVESPCIDAGDPNGDYTGQKDIDGEPRVFDGDYNEVPIVDMGADEYYWSPADINSDGFVNFFDYAFFASAWQSDPNDPNYNEDCDLEDNNSIDYNDIALFCEDWLWQTAWAKAFPCP
ncbi:MAG: hypothetical protein GWN00_14405, partial [Aliifodinibius sp.]|nr:hypothetical protein [Phycisphaerae bacterium]NIT57371.1 hypothetical protein [Fodinibius sp.]NIV14706.1 hypothetical protein [Fodinibius sp.]NIY25953.1 hypothetical protein [Fodinibius sp.]